jgi:succinate dehydrogenase / fumarate reductase, cytochrome b subunit
VRRGPQSEGAFTETVVARFWRLLSGATFLSGSGGIERDPVATTTSTSGPFLARNGFRLRRLHSFLGLVPVGAYMTVHLLTNASLMEGPATYQRLVYQIHALGKLLPLVEWGFIFLPILFHAALGVVIILGGRWNLIAYPYTGNFRYTLQRITAVIVLLFILLHVFHMHGWFHAEGWLQHVAHPLGGHQFRPYSAASSLGAAMNASPVLPVLYAVGVLAGVIHLANGIWTLGITWGIWTSPAAQRRANWICGAFGIFLAIVGMSALYASVTVDQARAAEVETRMYEAKVSSGELVPIERKRAAPNVDTSH